jgi:hypothetical protein
VLCGHVDGSAIPQTYAEYEEKPCEYRLSSINALLTVQTRISDLFNNPYDQVREPLRVTFQPAAFHRLDMIQRGYFGLWWAVLTPRKTSST